MGSLAPVRCLKWIVTLYQKFSVHFSARRGRLQSDISKTLA
jgi:hypothetical protein